MGEIDGVLLDIDGVLAISWDPLPGAIGAIEWMRASDVPFRLITNTTTMTRAHLAQTLRAAGFDVRDDELITAAVATAEYLRTHHPGARCFLLSDGDPSGDLDGIELVGVDDADVIVLGGACEDFTYPLMDRIFRRMMDGVTLIGMHRNMYWRTRDGLELDSGAYIAGLEQATRRTVPICGKPTGPFFDAAIAMLSVPRGRVVMVGDDIVNDVHGAQVLGIRGALVKTGKFLPSDLENGQEPDHVLESIADLPALVSGAKP